MHLRFAAKNVERRMRRDRRIDWRPEYSKVAGVIRLDAIPESRQELKELIQNHYHYAIKNDNVRYFSHIEKIEVARQVG